MVPQRYPCRPHYFILTLPWPVWRYRNPVGVYAPTDETPGHLASFYHQPSTINDHLRSAVIVAPLPELWGLSMVFLFICFLLFPSSSLHENLLRGHQLAPSARWSFFLFCNAHRLWPPSLLIDGGHGTGEIVLIQILLGYWAVLLWPQVDHLFCFFACISLPIYFFLLKGVARSSPLSPIPFRFPVFVLQKKSPALSRATHAIRRIRPTPGCQIFWLVLPTFNAMRAQNA